MPRQSIGTWLLRIGIAGVFLYAGVASFLYPDFWIGYIPTFVHPIISEKILLTVFSIYQVVLGVWIISSFKTFFAASLACLTLVGIILANRTDIDILFRDIAIIFASASLAVYYWNKR
jgi:uncharacterized membrane protein YphA (DoxX/SURF4 family)